MFFRWKVKKNIGIKHNFILDLSHFERKMMSTIRRDALKYHINVLY